MSYTINLKVHVINELISLIAFFVTIAAIVLMGIAAFILRRKKRAGN
jgi:LPXTG-motif cell wall-anchored protein